MNNGQKQAQSCWKRDETLLPSSNENVEAQSIDSSSSLELKYTETFSNDSNISPIILSYAVLE